MTARSIPLAAGSAETRGPIAPAAIRLTLLLFIVLAAAAAVWPASVPSAAVLQPAPGGFSAQRALQDLEAITAQPRVPGTPGYEEARAYLAAQFAALGLQPETPDLIHVEQHGEAAFVTVAQAHNIVARLKGTDSTGAILIGGHLDTVATTTAASDCGGCAVGVLEAARALASGAPLRNDVIFLIEDGEETSRAGAFAFVEQHPWAKDVRVAINQEAMGTSGASMLYVTGPQNGWLMRQALRALPAPVTYSAVNDLIWLTGTGGSDLDQFLMAAPVGLGFAYLNNVPAYHTVQDDIASLDPRSLQQTGDNVVALARHLGNLPLDGTLTAPDRVYFNLLGHIVVSYPQWVGIGLALLAALGLAAILVTGLRRGVLAGRGLLLGAALFLPLVIAATVASAALWQAIRTVDPRLQVFLIGVTYDREWYTLAFVAFAIGVTTAGYALLRGAAWQDLSVGALVWWALLAVVTAFTLPGSSPIFAIPALLGLLPPAVAMFQSGQGGRWPYCAALGLAGVGSVLVVAPMIHFLGIFSGRAEVILEQPAIGALPAPFAAMLAGLLLPLLGGLGGRRRWVAPAAWLGLAVVVLVGVGLTARFSEDRPKPNMVAYVQDEDQAHWVTIGGKVGNRRAALLDEWTRQFFPGAVEESVFSPWGFPLREPTYPAYQTPAPASDIPPAQLAVAADAVGADGLRTIRLEIASPAGAPMRMLHVASAAPIEQASVAGEPLDAIASAAQPAHEFWTQVFGLSHKPLALILAVRGEGAVTITVEERIYALPDLPGITITPRPDWMIPSPTFVTDTSLIRRTFVVQ